MIGVPPSVVNVIDKHIYKVMYNRRDLTINGKKVPLRWIIQKRNSQQLNKVAENITNAIHKKLLECY